MKQTLFNHIKNVSGWKTKRKLVAFCVDDYGNVRLDSPAARKALINDPGPSSENRFDRYDCLESRADLEDLFEVLTSVTDGQGRPAIFTPYAVPCNIDFETMASERYQTYRYESLPITFQKMTDRHPAAYQGTWQLWQEGMKRGLLRPQFHNREHLNLKWFERQLAQGDTRLLANLNQRSLAAVGGTDFLGSRWTAAFAFWDPVGDTAGFMDILHDGLDRFQDVFGYAATCFTPPAQQFPSFLIAELASLAIKAIDRPFFRADHVGYGKHRYRGAVTGYSRQFDLVHLVRNVVFEPTHGQRDHLGLAMQQIAAAFRWGKAAIISSHRVNFSGFIVQENRRKGLEALQALLQQIAKRWPDVEFIDAGQLATLIRQEHAASS